MPQLDVIPDCSWRCCVKSLLNPNKSLSYKEIGICTRSRSRLAEGRAEHTSTS